MIDYCFRAWAFTASVILCLVSPALAESDKSDSQGKQPQSKDSSIDGVVVGIMGHYRLGHPTAVRIDADLLGGADRDGLQIETTDGEGVRVVSSTMPGMVGADEIAYVVPGSEAAPLEIRSGAVGANAIEAGETGTSVSGESKEIAAASETIVATRFPTAGVPARGASLIPPDMPWVVLIGDSLGVDQIGVSKLLGRQSRIAVSDVDDAAALPASLLGYSGVDLVMINASGIEILQEMSIRQQAALESWLRDGGRIFICLGKSTEQMVSAVPWLTKHLPVEQWQTTRLDPAAIETYVASQTPLGDFQGARLPRREGRILLTGRTTRRVTAVLASEYLVGFGRVLVVAADLESSTFQEWPERLKLVTQLTGNLFVEEDRDGRKVDRGTLFNDLAGQMRGTLDQFPLKPSFSFSLVSVIVMLFAIAIGPIDYLLINRLLGKPLLGWLTFPIAAIALSAVLVQQASPRLQAESVKPNSSVMLEAGEQASMNLLRANQFQVVDLDLVDGVGRGLCWTYLYSHGPGKVDVMVRATDDVPVESVADSKQQSLNQGLVISTYSMGYPGAAFGGIQLAGENTTLPGYEIKSEQQDRSVVDELSRLTLAPRSSKSVASSVSFSATKYAGDPITRRPGSELLRGPLVNPLSVDLLDGMLIYQNWVYLLPTRLRAGDQIPAIEELRQKNFRWRLTQREVLEKSATKTTPWNPGDFDAIGRIAEMLLFHQSAGGELYTGLRHQHLGELDLSHVLVDTRCMLVGRTEKPLLQMHLSDRTAENQEAFDPDGVKHSMVRVVLPVRETRLK